MPSSAITVPEGENRTLVASLSASTTVDVTATLAFSPSAYQNTYFTVSTATVTIPAGDTSVSLSLTATENSVYTGNLLVGAGSFF